MRADRADYEACLGILEREAGLLAELAPVQEAVTRAVILREWEGFDASVNSLAELSGRFEELEAERERVFSTLPGVEAGETRFYAGTAAGNRRPLPGPQGRIPPAPAGQREPFGIPHRGPVRGGLLFGSRPAGPHGAGLFPGGGPGSPGYAEHGGK